MTSNSDTDAPAIGDAMSARLVPFVATFVPFGDGSWFGG